MSPGAARGRCIEALLKQGYSLKTAPPTILEANGRSLEDYFVCWGTPQSTSMIVGKRVVMMKDVMKVMTRDVARVVTRDLSRDVTKSVTSYVTIDVTRNVVT